MLLEIQPTKRILLYSYLKDWFGVFFVAHPIPRCIAGRPGRFLFCNKGTAEENDSFSICNKDNKDPSKDSAPEFGHAFRVSYILAAIVMLNTTKP